MIPTDPIWLLAEVAASLARVFREFREKRAERARVSGLLPPGQSPAYLAVANWLSPAVKPEPDRLPDPIYARVQASMLEFSRKRDMTRTDRSIPEGSFPGGDAVSWQIDGREVVVRESGNPLFRATWSEREGGWRLFWARNAERWWPYVNGSHLSIGSFEACVREVERDPRSCFPGNQTIIRMVG